MSSIRGAVTKALSDYSEACFGHWKIDGYETDNSVYYLPDSSPRNNTLEFVSAPSAGFDAVAGRGTFNGTSDYFADAVDAVVGELQFGKDKDPSHVAADSLPSIIISFSINTSDTGGNRYPILAKGTGGTNFGASIVISAAGLVGFLWQNHDPASTTDSSNGSVNDGVDHHVVVLIDRNNNKLEWYIDGVLDKSTAIGTVYTKYCDLVTGGDAEFRFGRFGSTYFDGQLWNVQCYRTYKDIPIGSIALRLGWAEALNAGNYLTKTDLDDNL